MLLLFRDDSGDGGNGCGVIATQGDKLLLEMSEHNALYSGGSDCDGVGPKQTGDGTKHEAADAAQRVATTAPSPPTLQLGAEYGPMPLLMRPELSELVDHASCGEVSHKDLAGVNAYGAMLASVIDLDDPIAEIIGHRLHECFHEA